MKYLAAPNGSPLTFPFGGGEEFLAFDGTRHAAGTVAETTEAWLKRAAAAALPQPAPGAVFVPIDADDPHPFSFVEAGDIMRDVRWIGKFLAREDIAVGTEGIAMKASGRGVTLVVPASAKPEAYAPKAGDKVAVGPNISPKALMNARGEVLSVNGTRATVRLAAGDIKRVERATGKKFAQEARLPIASIERDED